MRTLAARLFAPDAATGGGVLWPRWIFLRCLGLIFFSAFYSLAFQIQGCAGNGSGSISSRVWSS